MSEHNDMNRGVLFKNDRKENDRQPDYTGKINVKGTEQRLSAWVQTSSKGMKYLSIACSDPLPKEDQPQAQPSVEEFNDEVPF